MNRAQSESIGVILLTAVMVIVVGGFGVLYLGAAGDGGGGPLLDGRIDVTHDEVSVTHGGGATVALDDLSIVLRGVETTERYPFDAGNISRTVADDDRFEPGERFRRAHGLPPGPVTLLVVHEGSNAVVAQEYLDVPETGGERGGPGGPITWATADDWNRASAQDGVLHESFGDRSADAVELGYPTGGQWGPTPVAYWPLDEDGGTIATDVVGDNDGTVTGPTVGVEGTLGTTGYAFDGSDDYVDDADVAALRETATLSLWLNTTQAGSDTAWQAPGVTGVESEGDGDDVFWGWLDASGHVGVQAGDQPAAVSTTAIDDGAWHHVVLTRNATTGEVAVYVDGTLEDTATSRTGTITTTFASLGRIEDTGGTPGYFDGRLEDVQVYDRVLAADEVDALASVTAGSLTTGAKAFREPVDPSRLTLSNVSASVPAGTNATAVVHADPDGDGTFQERSDGIDLASGSSNYEVSGLASASTTFRIEVDLATDDPRVTPVVRRLELDT